MSQSAVIIYNQAANMMNQNLQPTSSSGKGLFAALLGGANIPTGAHPEDDPDHLLEGSENEELEGQFLERSEDEDNDLEVSQASRHTLTAVNKTLNASGIQINNNNNNTSLHLNSSKNNIPSPLQGSTKGGGLNKSGISQSSSKNGGEMGGNGKSPNQSQVSGKAKKAPPHQLRNGFPEGLNRSVLPNTNIEQQIRSVNEGGGGEPQKREDGSLRVGSAGMAPFASRSLDNAGAIGGGGPEQPIGEGEGHSRSNSRSNSNQRANAPSFTSNRNTPHSLKKKPTNNGSEKVGYRLEAPQIVEPPQVRAIQPSQTQPLQEASPSQGSYENGFQNSPQAQFFSNMTIEEQDAAASFNFRNQAPAAATSGSPNQGHSQNPFAPVGTGSFANNNLQTVTLDRLEAEKEALREIFKEYQSINELLPLDCVDIFVSHIQQETLSKLITSTRTLSEIVTQLQQKLTTLIQSKQQDGKFKDAMHKANGAGMTPPMSLHQSQMRSETLSSEAIEQEVGLTFNEVYHQLFMALLSAIERRKSVQLTIHDHHHDFGGGNSRRSDLLGNYSGSKVEYLNTNPNSSRRNMKLDTSKFSRGMNTLDEDKKYKMLRLQTIFDGSRNDVEVLIRKRTGQTKQLTDEQLKELISSIIESLPVKIVKMHNYDQNEDFSHQMTKMRENKAKMTQQQQKEQLQAIIQGVIRSLDTQAGNSGGRSNRQVVDYDQILQGFKDALLFQEDGDDYEIIEKDEVSEQDLQELEGLDDFLLQDQGEGGRQSPTLLDHLRESIKTYQTMIDSKKVKNEGEKQKLQKVIKSMQAQVDTLMKEQVREHKLSQQNNNKLLKKLDTKIFMPNVLINSSNQAAKSVGLVSQKTLKPTTKQEKREKVLKGVFDFYAKQQLLVGKRATFDEIRHEFEYMNMGEFFRFALDFKLPLKKEKVLETFKKQSENHREISYEGFKELMKALFIEVNKERARNLKKRLENINTKNIIGLAVYKDAQKQLINIKKKSADQIMEEVYAHLELDHPQNVEKKKKGLNLPFNVRDKEAPSVNNLAGNASNATLLGTPDNQQHKVKLRQFSQEEKQEIKDRVKQIRQERDKKKKEEADALKNRYYLMRQRVFSSNESRKQTAGQSEERSEFDQYRTLEGGAKGGMTIKGQLTLQQLTKISYQDLNSKNEDDFNPLSFGFEQDPPLPEKEESAKPSLLLQTPVMIAENTIEESPTAAITSGTGMMLLSQGAEITQNGIQNGLIWNRGNLMPLDKYNHDLMEQRRIHNRANRLSMVERPPFTVNGQQQSSFGRSQPMQQLMSGGGMGLGASSQKRLQTHSLQDRNNRLSGPGIPRPERDQLMLMNYPSASGERLEEIPKGGSWVDHQFNKQSQLKSGFGGSSSNQNSMNQQVPLKNNASIPTINYHHPQHNSHTNLVNYYNRASNAHLRKGVGAISGAGSGGPLSLPPIPSTTKASDHRVINF